MNLTTYIKQQWSRYRAWQRNPIEFEHIDSLPHHHCPCCERDYQGNFCPVCGQRSGQRHLTFATVRSGLMDLWGMGTRSMPYTLWQLIWRPGYLIGDYISGRRQVSFPPIKMLVFVAVFVMLLSNLIDPSETLVDDVEKGSNQSLVKLHKVIDYLDMQFTRHYDRMAAFTLSFLIVPTYFVFRYSPRCPRHTLVEGFFIQIFIGTIQLMLLLLDGIVSLIFGDDSLTSSTIVGGVAALMLWRTYRQLFGYNGWFTLWRLLLTFVIAFFILLAVVVLVFMVFMIMDRNVADLPRVFLGRFMPFALVAFGLTYACHYFSKKCHDSSENHSDATDGVSRPDDRV